MEQEKYEVTNLRSSYHCVWSLLRSQWLLDLQSHTIVLRRYDTTNR